jgi:hypothetical protein
MHSSDFTLTIEAKNLSYVQVVINSVTLLHSVPSLDAASDWKHILIVKLRAC